MQIAVDVFGKPEHFDVSQDATVRVYIHRLRRKLAEFYDGEHAETATRLVIPKGEYRITTGDRAIEPVAKNAARLKRSSLIALSRNHDCGQANRGGLAHAARVQVGSLHEH